MFQTTITQTPLTTTEANEYFTNIIGESWSRDVSFVSSLRALLAPRMPEGDTLRVSFSTTNKTKDDIDSYSSKSRAIRSISGPEEPGNLKIVMLCSSGEDNDAWFDLIDSCFESMEGWHSVEKVQLFFRNLFRVQCYINPELKSTFLFTSLLDMRRLHYLQCGILAFLPWYFDKEAGVSELEMELIRSFREKKPDSYMECIAKIAEQYDFEKIKIRKLLTGFESKYERIQCEEARQQLEYIIRSINELNSRIGEALRKKTDVEIKLAGLEMKIEDTGNSSEIMDYFLANKHLVLKSVTDTSMEFVVKASLDFFDEDVATRVLEKESSYFYSNCSDRRGGITRDDMKMLMKAIFIDQSLRLQFCAAYRFNLVGNVDGLRGYDYGPELAEYMPNPHIDRYACLGNYNVTINERLKEHDYIGAIEQCISSCKSLNLCDTPVMSEFMNSVFNGGRRCVVLPDGSAVKMKEAIEWLKSQQEPNEEMHEGDE